MFFHSGTILAISLVLTLGTHAALAPRASSTPGTCYICSFEDQAGDDIISSTSTSTKLTCTYQYETCTYSTTTGLAISTSLLCPKSASPVNYLCPTSDTTGSALKLEEFQDYGANFPTTQCTYANGDSCDYNSKTGILENTNTNHCPANPIECSTGTPSRRRRDNLVAVQQKKRAAEKRKLMDNIAKRARRAM